MNAIGLLKNDFTHFSFTKVIFRSDSTYYIKDSNQGGFIKIDGITESDILLFNAKEFKDINQNHNISNGFIFQQGTYLCLNDLEMGTRLFEANSYNKFDLVTKAEILSFYNCFTKLKNILIELNTSEVSSIQFTNIDDYLSEKDQINLRTIIQFTNQVNALVINTFLNFDDFIFINKNTVYFSEFCFDAEKLVKYLLSKNKYFGIGILVYKMWKSQSEHVIESKIINNKKILIINEFSDNLYSHFENLLSLTTKNTNNGYYNILTSSYNNALISNIAIAGLDPETFIANAESVPPPLRVAELELKHAQFKLEPIPNSNPDTQEENLAITEATILFEFSIF